MVSMPKAREPTPLRAPTGGHRPPPDLRDRGSDARRLEGADVEVVEHAGVAELEEISGNPNDHLEKKGHGGTGSDRPQEVELSGTELLALLAAELQGLAVEMQGLAAEPQGLAGELQGLVAQLQGLAAELQGLVAMMRMERTRHPPSRRERQALPDQEERRAGPRRWRAPARQPAAPLRYCPAARRPSKHKPLETPYWPSRALRRPPASCSNSVKKNTTTGKE